MKSKENKLREKAKRRLQRKKKKAKKIDRAKVKIAEKAAGAVIIGQAKQRIQPTFQRNAWQSLQPPDNTMQNDTDDGVLDDYQGFNMNAWSPPDEQEAEKT